jgi:hypothetical protein
MSMQWMKIQIDKLSMKMRRVKLTNVYNRFTIINGLESQIMT